MPLRIANPYITTQVQRFVFSALRSRLLCVFFLTTTMFLILSFNVKMSEYSFNTISNLYGESHQEWIEVYVPGQVRTVRVKTYKESTPYSNSSTKTILLWTTYFSNTYSDDFYFFQKEQETFEKYNCKVSNCYVTANRSLLPKVDAVLFHATDVNSSDIPERIRQDQVWILYSMEPPNYAHFKWHYIRSRFNWTMTYRSDSDVQVKYGEIIPVNDSSIRNLDYQKRNGAVWMVSNCRTESRREAYVKELRKHFKVDIYGKCSRLKKCEPTQSQKCYELLKNYRFYLSFENSICQDYVTEKFFNVLMYDVVPVVFGGASYVDFAPKDSYIDATRFPNPKDLASYLSAVANNSTLYNSFFKWKDQYKVHLHAWMCDLCEHLHEKGSEIKMLPYNLWSWWVPGASCRKWTKNNGFRNIF